MNRSPWDWIEGLTAAPVVNSFGAMMRNFVHYTAFPLPLTQRVAALQGNEIRETSEMLVHLSGRYWKPRYLQMVLFPDSLDIKLHTIGFCHAGRIGNHF